jgi:hypothetical protein
VPAWWAPPILAPEDLVTSGVGKPGVMIFWKKIYINEFVDVSKFVASMLYNKAMGKIHYYKKAL